MSGTLGEADRGCLNNGGTLDDAIFFLFDRDFCEDYPIPIFFNDLPLLVSFWVLLVVKVP